MKLSSVYFDAVYKLPESLRMRRPLEESVIRSVEEGKSICIRGFWRIGKTEMMKAAIQQLSSRNRACGLHFDLRSETSDDGLPKSRGEVLSKIGQRVKHLFNAFGYDLEIDLEDPLAPLGAIEGPVYLGVDELIAIDKLPPGDIRSILGLLKEAPPNVRLLLVAHRHQAMDGVFEEQLCSEKGIRTVFIPPLEDDEMERLIREPAMPYGFGYTDDAVSLLSSMTGNKPWEALSLCYMIADRLEETGIMRPGIAVGADAVRQLTGFEDMKADQLGVWPIDNYLRILLKAMAPDEAEAIRKIAKGEEVGRQACGRALGRLFESGWARDGSPLEVNSSIFAEVIMRLESGKIRIEEDGKVIW